MLHVYSFLSNMCSNKTKIEELYENQKSRGFVNHLIHAYFPTSKINKVLNFEDNKSVHRCSICGQELIDVETVFQRVQKSREFAGEFVDEIRKDMTGKPTKFEDRFMVKHITKGAVIGWTGEKTTTYVCQQCLQDLFNMVTHGLLCGDKNINYQINKMKRSEFFNTFAASSELNSSEIKTVKDIQKKIEKAPSHKATFGDFEVLQRLKEKMENEEKL